MPNMNKFSGGSTELTGNAVASEVLSGKTFYSNNEEQKLTGTMANMSAPHYQGNPNIGNGSSGWIGFNIPQAGYYKPSTYLWKYARDLDIGNAEPWCCPQGYNFTSKNGVKLEGTAPFHKNTTDYINAGETYQIPWGHYDGTSKVMARHAKLKYLGELTLSGAGLGNTLTQQKTATFNVAQHYSKYAELKHGDFCWPIKEATAGTAEQFGNIGMTDLKYNNQTGILTIYYNASSYYNNASATVYIYIIDRYGL